MNKENKYSIYFTAAILLIVGGVFIWSFLMGVKVSLKDDYLVVDGLFFNEKISYQSIEKVELVDDVKYGIRTFGSDFILIKSGDFKNEQFGHYKLCTYSDNKQNIAIMADGRYVVFNLKTTSATEKLYQEIKNIINYK